MQQTITISATSQLFAQSSLTREVFGNVSPLSKLIFYILATLAIGCFTIGLWRKTKRWQIGRKIKKRPIRFAGLWREVFLQQRLRHHGMKRGLASLAHLLLFSGFVVLFIGTLLIAVEHILASLLGRDADQPVFHFGTYYAIYEMILDTFGVAFILGTMLFIKRRLKKPSSLGHEFWDWVILLSFLMIGVSGFLTEGLRIIQQQTYLPGYSPIGYLVAKIFYLLGVTQQNAQVLHLSLWWIHAILALTLIAAFPYSRLFHFIAGAINIARTDTQLGTMQPISIEQVEETGIIGVATFADFDWNQMVQLDACVSCGRCEDACPAFAAGKPLSPKAVVQDIKAALNGFDDSIAANSIVYGEVIQGETLWACTTCSACQDVCPLRVNPLQMITDLRRNVVGEGQLRGNAATTLQKIQRSGNPWGMAQTERFDWAEGLDVPTVETNPGFELLYWVGCAASYDRRVQKVAQAVVKLLTQAKVNFACLGNREKCNAETARRMGDEFLFQEQAESNLQTLSKYNVKKIVTHCPHCLNSFKNDYPQFGSEFEVVHHTQLLSELLEQGKFQLHPQKQNELQQQVAFHDPCYLARVNQVTEEPRQLIQLSAVGDKTPIIELARSRRNTACCGAGGGRMWVDDSVSQRVGRDRIEEVIATGAETLAVACPFCMIMMRDGLANQNSQIEVRDVAEIFADALLLS